MKKLTCNLLSTVAIISLFLGTSCAHRQTRNATDVDESMLFGHYKVTYDEASKDLHLFAQFRANSPDGKSIRLNGGSKIAAMVSNSLVDFKVFDGDAHTLSNLDGTYYSLAMEGFAPEKDYTFYWTKTNGDVHKNTVHLGSPLKIVSPENNDIHKEGKPLTVTFSPAVSDNEEVTCFLNIDNLHLNIKASAKEGATTCTFDHGLLVGFLDRNSTLKVSRKMTLNRPQSGHEKIGGILEGIYNAKPVTIKISK